MTCTEAITSNPPRRILIRQGNTVAEVIEEQAEPLECNLRFQGQYADAESGLHYNRFRYYEPEVGRYCTQDPIGTPGGLHLYAYAPNPTTWIDALGLTKRCGKVYRALTPDQEAQAAAGQAILPKSLNNPHTIQQHVENGKNRTQFLSTTKLPDRAAFYAKRRGAKIIEIDLCNVPDHQIIDISDGADLVNNPQRGQFAKNWAIKDQEVLIRGSLPPGSYRVVN